MTSAAASSSQEQRTVQQTKLQLEIPLQSGVQIPLDPGAATSSFRELCRGLQGLWVEVGGARKQWIVEGSRAHLIREGSRSYKFMAIDGGLAWGQNKKYYLDRQFDRRAGVASWRGGCPDGPEAFLWRAVADTTGRQHVRPEATRNRPSPAHELRLDPHFNEAFTWHEMRAAYASHCTLSAIAKYWSACRVVGTRRPVQRRVDPATGIKLTWEEMRDLHAEEYTEDEVAIYWTGCRDVPAEEVECSLQGF